MTVFGEICRLVWFPSGFKILTHHLTCSYWLMMSKSCCQSPLCLDRFRSSRVAPGRMVPSSLSLLEQPYLYYKSINHSYCMVSPCWVHCNTRFVLYSYIKDVAFKNFFHGHRPLGWTFAPVLAYLTCMIHGIVMEY